MQGRTAAAQRLCSMLTLCKLSAERCRVNRLWSSYPLDGRHSPTKGGQDDLDVVPVLERIAREIVMGHELPSLRPRVTIHIGADGIGVSYAAVLAGGSSLSRSHNINLL